MKTSFYAGASGLVLCASLVACGQPGGPGASASLDASSSTGMSPPAAIAFSCPASGTKVSTTNAVGTAVATWNGAAAGNPTLCLQTDGNGRQTTRLYAFYPVPLISGENDARVAIAAAFAGAATPKCFQTSEQPSSVGGTNSTYIYERCWSQLGSTTITSGGKPTKVVVFAVSDEGKAGNYYAADWKYYYDPATGIIVQGDVSMRRGSPSMSYKRVVVPG